MTLQEPKQSDQTLDDTTSDIDLTMPAVEETLDSEERVGEIFSELPLEEQAAVIAGLEEEIAALEIDYDEKLDLYAGMEPGDEEYSGIEIELIGIEKKIDQSKTLLGTFIPLHSIELARNFSQEVRQLLPKTAVIDLKKIRWARSDEEKEVELKLVENSSDPRGSYYFAGFITGENSSTKKAHDNFDKQSEAKKLTKLLIEEKIPAALIELENTGKIRSSGGAYKPDSDYDDYKIDLGGTNNRVILLQVGTAEDGRKIIVVAAVYKHTDESMIYNALDKAKRQKPS